MSNLSFRLLPALMIAAAICFGIRFSDAMGRSAMSDAEMALIETAAGDEAKPADDAAGKADAPPMTGAAAAIAAAKNARMPQISPPQMEPDVSDKTAAPSQDELGQAPPVDPNAKPVTESAAPTKDTAALGAPPKQGNWKGADDLDDQYTDVKMELFNDLAKRRKDIEAKEKDLAMREALLKTGQAELEQKYKELTGIKSDIEALLKKQSDEEDKRITSLVKIYEGMKAKDAARIFDSLDMDVLLQVVTRMSERKSAPILAAMDPDKARNVTILLAEQNKLPTLPALDGSDGSGSPAKATP